MKLLIVTDAWYPQVNGVVRTLTEIRDGLRRRGWQVEVLGPSGATLACPGYKEIRLTLRPTTAVSEIVRAQEPDYIHIATEGPLGMAMRRYCLARGWRFTTSFHTRFPEYLKAMFGVPRRWTYTYLRRFHAPSAHVLIPTSSILSELEERGFSNAHLWGRGVDADLFHPNKRVSTSLAGPVFLYVGRLAVEKNIEAFLRADTGGTKVVVGDGPAREALQRKYPQILFKGTLHGEDLAQVYASADVFVFPSRTDTFGLVLLEALASGLPVAAYDVPGPRDVIGSAPVGVLGEDLGAAARAALQLDREACRDFALQHSWERSIQQFEARLETKREAHLFTNQMLTKNEQVPAIS